MVTADKRFRDLALALPEAEEKSHFSKADFRIRNKIFAGFNDRGIGYVKLTTEQQDMLCASEPTFLRAIPGGWGKQGWTEVEHKFADELLLRSVLLMAWKNIATKTMIKTHFPE